MEKIILRDGSICEIRKANKNDKDALCDLFTRSSDRSRYFRFFTATRNIDSKIVEEMINADGINKLTLICTMKDIILGVGNYIKSDEPFTAEVALFVDDNQQGKGIGTILLEQTAHFAWLNGFRFFEAYVLLENQKMLNVFKNSGFEIIKKDMSLSEVYVMLPLIETERVRSIEATREKLATAASLKKFFSPSVIAIVGASRNTDKLGYLIFKNILNANFKGIVYPVNKKAAYIAGVKAYSSLKDIKEHIDLAIVVVPYENVLDIIQEAISINVGAILITSSGFSETKDYNRIKYEKKIVTLTRKAGIRLIGPNSLGILNTDSNIHLNASFISTFPPAGKVAIASHSGTLGMSIINYATCIGMGISNFISFGNKADVSGNDLLQYWEDDPNTDIVILYLDSFGNPRKFSKICQNITRKKPILAVKSAKTLTSVALSEHVSQALMGKDITIDSLFKQRGIIRADTLEELFDIAVLLNTSPLPKSNRVGIVTNSNGGSVIAVDAFDVNGLELAKPPINIWGESKNICLFKDAVLEMLKDPDIDSILVIFAPVVLSDENEIINALNKATEEFLEEKKDKEFQKYGKPIILNLLSTSCSTLKIYSRDSTQIKLPIYPFPERAVKALGKILWYGNFIRKPRGRIPDLDNMDTKAAREMIRNILSKNNMKMGKWLTKSEASDLFNMVGIGFNSEVNNTGDIKAKVAIGTLIDKSFGPLIGIVPLWFWKYSKTIFDSDEYNNNTPIVYKSPLVRITPITDIDAKEMVEEIFNLKGMKKPTKCLLMLEELLLRLSRLIEEVPEIIEIDMLDIEMMENGYIIKQANIHIAMIHAI